MPRSKDRSSSEMPGSKLAWEFLENVKGWTKATKGKGHRLTGPEDDGAPMMQDQVGPSAQGFGSAKNAARALDSFPLPFPFVLSACCFSVDGRLGWVADGLGVFVGARLLLLARGSSSRALALGWLMDRTRHAEVFARLSSTPANCSRKPPRVLRHAAPPLPSPPRLPCCERPLDEHASPFATRSCRSTWLANQLC